MPNMQAVVLGLHRPGHGAQQRSSRRYHEHAERARRSHRLALLVLREVRRRQIQPTSRWIECRGACTARSFYLSCVRSPPGRVETENRESAVVAREVGETSCTIEDRAV